MITIMDTINKLNCFTSMQKIYNQTYVSGATSFDKADTNTGDNIYDNLYPPNAQSNNIYGDYPPYYDYFQGTYRKFSSKWKNLDKILDWIQVAHET